MLQPIPIAKFLSAGTGMGEMAAALGQTADETHYKALLTKLKPEWHQAFWDPKSSAYSTGTQVYVFLDDVSGRPSREWVDHLLAVPSAC